MHIIQIEGISKSYDGSQALSNVSLSIPRGSIFGLLGPNGAGKTTLLRILNQIIAKDEGEILLNGTPLQREHVRKLGYLPEERGLYKKMKVGKQIEYFAKLKGLSKNEARAKSDMWLKKLNLYEERNKRTMELSKGMQQKVQFIITVIHEPELMILDEPFSGFDPINAQLIKDEILALKKSGTTILLSTHRMENVEEICDNVALLNKSHKVLDGPINEVREAYKGNRYKIRCSSELSGSSNYEILKSKNDNGKFEYVLKIQGDSNDFLKEVLQQGEVYHFEEIIPSMEEIFFTVVKGGQNV
jgi:ABC-2 type transport system ATP-binding protein